MRSCVWFESSCGLVYCQNPWYMGEKGKNKEWDLNSKHPFPKVLGYKKRSDIKEIDIIEFIMCLYLCGTRHACIYCLYNMKFLGSMSVMLIMSQSYYRGRFKLESFGLQTLCYYIEVIELSSVVLKRQDCNIILILGSFYLGMKHLARCIE